MNKIKSSLICWMTLLLTLVSSQQVYAADKITFYHYDLLGSPVATTNELGEVVWREEYSPYGDKLLKQDAGKDNVRGYTGHVFDEETGLTYMQARYYDPQIGRFMGVDPVGFDAKNPISFNRYAYAGDNPYKYTDPNGMCFWDACTLESFAVAGLVKAGIYFGTALIAAYSADKVINAYSESEEAKDPEIKRQKQDEHIYGTPGYKNRTKQNPDNPPSTWDNPEEADDLTREAWANGTPDPNNPNIKTYETGTRVGTKGDGITGQSGVKVTQDSKGKIHGHPYGEDRSQVNDSQNSTETE